MKPMTDAYSENCCTPSPAHTQDSMRLTLHSVSGDGLGDGLHNLWICAELPEVLNHFTIPILLYQQAQLLLVGHDQTHGEVLVTVGANAHLSGEIQQLEKTPLLMG